MHIRRWLKGLIVFLLAPCLLFATLWFSNKFEHVYAIDRSLDGLQILQALGPLMQEKALTGAIAHAPEGLRSRMASLGGQARADDLLKDLDIFLIEENVPIALRRAQFLSETVSQLAKMTASSSFETSKFPHLINNTLLSVVIESSIMADNARTLAAREWVNTWDKMLIPVQGGQFKVAADGAARETATYFKSLAGDEADTLRQVATLYRKTNLDYQSAGSKLLSSVIDAERGSDIIARPVTELQPELVRAAFVLWQAALDYLNADLQEQRTRMLLAVAAAGLVGGLVIIAAFVIAIVLSRALADRTQKEFENLGFHDPLTGLPNRRALTKAIRALPDPDAATRTGLLLIDLRHFKKFNDRFGDHNGDAMLREVAQQLGHFAEPDDIISRTGGTEFMLLRPRLENAADFEKLADSVIRDLGKDRFVTGHKTMLEANAGLFISPKGEKVNEHMLVDAALALRSAKQKGPRQRSLFTREMRAAFEENGTIAKGLLKGLKEGDVRPWFQPQVDVLTGEVVGAEALVRWIDHGRVRYPGSFLPAAIEAGYMDLIDATVREKTLQLAADLSGRTRRRMHLGLNTSASFLASAEAVETLNSQVREMGLEPCDISLEILEAVMIDEIAAEPIKKNVTRLAELGFFIELDDFGTGHSSISSLRDLKVDRVKIDRSFIQGVDANPDLQKFTSALINLARSLDISVLAEGVETQGELEWLSQNGCDVAQGFLISKAIPEDELAAMILQRNFASPKAVSGTLATLKQQQSA